MQRQSRKTVPAPDQQPRSLGRHDHPAAILAMILLAGPGATTGTILPVVVDALAGPRISVTLSLGLAAAQMTGMGAALLAASGFINKVDRRAFAAASLAIAVAATLATVITRDPPALFLLRGLVGAGCGVAYAIALASIAGSANSARNFGLFMATNQICGILLLAILPRVSAAGGLSHAMIALAIFTAASGAALPWLPRRGEHTLGPAQTTGLSRAVSRGPVLLGFGSMFLLAAAFGACWPIVGQIALAHGVSRGSIGSGLALAGFGGVAGGLAAAWLAPRLSDQRILTLGSLGFTASIALQAAPGASFTLAAVALMFFCAFNVPNYLNFVGKLDGAGRLPILMTALMQLGMAAGQAIVASLGVKGDGFPIILFATALASLSWAAVLFTVRLAKAAAARTIAVAPDGPLSD